MRTCALWLALALATACAGPSPSAPAANTAPAPAPAAPAASGTAPKPAGAAPLSPKETVRIGVLPVIAMAPFLIAEARGYFAEEGLESDLIRFDSGARMVAPLAAGQLDAGIGAHSAGLFNAIATGIDIKIVADNVLLIAGRSPSTIVTRRELYDAGLRGGADLRGKTFAVTALGSTIHVNAGRYLETQGLRLEDVSLVELGQADMDPALANGAIDLANNTEPFVTRGLEDGYAARLAAVSDYYPNREVSVLMYGREFMAERAEAARRLMVAYLRGVRVYEDAFSKNVDRDAVLDLLVEHLAIKDRTLYDRMYANGTLSYTNPDGYVSVESIAWDQDWLLAQGLQRQRVDLAQVIDHQYVDYALGRLGRYAR